MKKLAMAMMLGVAALSANAQVNYRMQTACNPQDVKTYDTQRLRSSFMMEKVLVADEINVTYSMYDRFIFGGAMPVNKELSLDTIDPLKAPYFLFNRELGVINIGGKGTMTLDGVRYDFDYKDGIYIGMGTKEVIFESADAENPAKFYFNSAPAHKTYPTVFINPEKDILPENKKELGCLENANHRTIRKYILPGQVESCQLEMGMTALEPGSVWNTMPCHTHDRRMEVYLYFEVPENDVVFHYMGEPTQTRHIVMRNEEAVISPSWSIHSASATHAYTFIWGMVGENQDFDDMDDVDMKDLR